MRRTVRPRILVVEDDHALCDVLPRGPRDEGDTLPDAAAPTPGGSHDRRLVARRAVLVTRVGRHRVGPDPLHRSFTGRAVRALCGDCCLAVMHALLPPPGAASHRDHVRPVAQTLSDYALHEGATGLFTACVGSAAAGSAALLAGLVRSRLPIGTAAPAVLGVGCAGLAFSAVFPTDPAGAVPSPAAWCTATRRAPRWPPCPRPVCCWPAACTATLRHVSGGVGYAACPGPVQPPRSSF
jgi:hypothetical protein